MNHEEPKDAAEHLDERWMDEALERFGAAEPRAGLETRILANLEAHAAQRQRRCIYTFAGAAAVVLFGVMIANVLSSKRSASMNEATRTLPAEVNSSSRGHKVAVGLPETSVHERHAIAHKNVTGNRMVLAADGVKQEQSHADKQLFAQGQSSSQNDLTQASEQEPESVIAQEHPAPEIYVSDLKTIQPIEVRELAPVKNIN